MLFCLRVMVGVIILYDYVHPAGAFVKSSKIDVCFILFSGPFSKSPLIQLQYINMLISCSISNRFYRLVTDFIFVNRLIRVLTQC